MPHELHDSPAASAPRASSHANIVSLLVNDVRHIAVPSTTRTFETLVCRLFRDTVGWGREASVAFFSPD